jgi:hypothetical protein
VRKQLAPKRLGATGELTTIGSNAGGVRHDGFL